MHEADHLGPGDRNAAAGYLSLMTRRVIWCLGMYASASTWLFNVVRQLSIASQSGEVRSWFMAAEMNGSSSQRGQIDLVKSHEIGDEAALLALAGSVGTIFITIRDPRDAIASMMEYHGHDFTRALGLVEASQRLCLGFAQDRRARVFRYEERFFETVGTVQTIATALGHDLPAAIIQSIFERLDRAEVDKYIADLPARAGVLQDRVSGDLVDPQTHWHSHHAKRTGEIGRWREKLSVPQLNEIELRLQGCARP